jgi:hypothetical protein
MDNIPFLSTSIILDLNHLLLPKSKRKIFVLNLVWLSNITLVGDGSAGETGSVASLYSFVMLLKSVVLLFEIFVST